MVIKERKSNHQSRRESTKERYNLWEGKDGSKKRSHHHDKEDNHEKKKHILKKRK